MRAGCAIPSGFPRTWISSPGCGTMRSLPLLPSILAALCACAGAEAGSGESSPSSDSAGVRTTAPAISGDTLIGPAKVGEYLLLDSATADVDGDGVAERVELAAGLGRDENGRLIGDHDPVWLVAVRDGDRTYPLLEENIPGAAAFWIVPENDGTVAILVQVAGLSTSGGGMRLEKFVFDRARAGYARTGSVGAFGHPPIYRGPPGMEDILPPTKYRDLRIERGSQ